MQILFFSHYFYPEVNAPASRIYEHGQEWSRLGHELTVVTSFPNAPEGIIYKGYKNKLFKRENIEGIKALRVWTYIAANKGIVRRTLNYLSYMASSLVSIIMVKETDVIIATSPQIFCAIAGWIVSVFKRKPFVLEVRDLWPDSIIAVGAINNTFIIKILQKVEMFLYERAKIIIVLSDAFKEYMINLGINEKKIHIIKNGVNLDYFVAKRKNEELINSLKLNGKWIISYIGTLGMAHGLSQICDVAEKLVNKRIVFLLVGSGAEKEKLQDLVKKRQLTNVLFIDRQSKKMVKEFFAISNASLIVLKKCNLFKKVLPSKIFEAMAMEKPILLGVDGEARLLVEEYAKSGLYFESENTNDLEKQINKLFSSSDLCHSFSENGRQYVETNFNRKKLAQNYIEILENNLK